MQLTIQGDRRLTLSALGSVVPGEPEAPFVTLLPAYTDAERRQAVSLAEALVARGCVEFCCVGPLAYRLHDELDEIIECESIPDVVTTWIEDLAEAREYFLHAAAGGRTNLLALIEGHPELAGLLRPELERDPWPRPEA